MITCKGCILIPCWVLRLDTSQRLVDGGTTKDLEGLTLGTNHEDLGTECFHWYICCKYASQIMCIGIIIFSHGTCV